MIDIPTIPSGTGIPKTFSLVSPISKTPPIPTFSSFWMISFAFSTLVPGIILKFAGIVPVPCSATSSTEVMSFAINASNGVIEVFL